MKQSVDSTYSLRSIQMLSMRNWQPQNEDSAYNKELSAYKIEAKKNKVEETAPQTCI